MDVRTVGAGGGSIAYVPELTGALRVGPDSAGAAPGPAAYDQGGELPTVTDANIVLGYLPAQQKLGGDMDISLEKARTAVQTIADAMGLTLKQAAEGIVKIVNENMFVALRLVSIEIGYDPRNFALIAFGGAGPLHGNSLGVLMQSWPVIVPPGPGVLCAFGDATTRMRDEASRTFITRLSATKPDIILEELQKLDQSARNAMLLAGSAESGGEGAQRISDNEVSSQLQVDLRYSGQGLVLTIETDAEELATQGFKGIGERFDELHEQLFTFSLEAEKELVNLRVVVEGPESDVSVASQVSADNPVEDAIVGDHSIYAEGQDHAAKLYDRSKLGAGHVIPGPAVVMEMDSTTLILPDHTAVVDAQGNLLINPNDI
jgi:N-methylhydantoinase A